MSDHQGVKTIIIFKFSFCMSNLKDWLPKEFVVEGPNKYNSNSIYSILYNFLKWISSVIFSLRSSVFDVYF